MDSNTLTKAQVATFAKFFFALAMSRETWRSAHIPELQSTMLTFWSGMLISELPIHVAMVQLWFFVKSKVISDAGAHITPSSPISPEADASVTAPPTKMQAAVDTAVRFCAAAAPLLALSTAYPLGELVYHQWSARDVFRRSLQTGGVSGSQLRRDMSAIKAANCIVPLPYPLKRNIECKASIVYGRVARKVRGQDTPQIFELKLDLYWHSNRKMANAPIFCYIHGGGWVTGHRTHHSLALLYEVARQGWLVATINYRLAPRSPFPTMLYDCKHAVAWLKTNAHLYGANKDFLAVGGESAGGHLSLMMALTGNVKKFQPRMDVSTGLCIDSRQLHNPSVKVMDVDTSVQGVVDLYGVTDWTDAGMQYITRNPKKGMQHFIGSLILKRRYLTHFEDFVEGSPFWWTFGSKLPDVLSRVGVKVREEERDEDPLRMPTMGSPGQQAAYEVHHDIDTSVTLKDSPHDIEGVKYRVMSTLCSLPAIAHMCEDRPIPPVLVIHGANDTLVPQADSVRFFNVLQQRRQADLRLNKPSPLISDVIVDLPGAHHAYNFVISPRTFATGDAVCDWLNALHSSWLARKEGDDMRARL
jgi:acetyl esterase/lipase